MTPNHKETVRHTFVYIGKRAAKQVHNQHIQMSLKLVRASTNQMQLCLKNLIWK